MRVFCPGLLAAAIVILPGCGIYDVEEQEPRSLSEVVVPQGFDFETTRPVSVEIEVAETVLPADQTVVLEVKRPDGAVLYRTWLPPNTQTATRLFSSSLPLRFDAVVLSLMGDGWTLEETVEISSDGTASYRFAE